jgi:protein TonB
MFDTVFDRDAFLDNGRLIGKAKKNSKSSRFNENRDAVSTFVILVESADFDVSKIDMESSSQLILFPGEPEPGCLDAGNALCASQELEAIGECCFEARDPAVAVAPAPHCLWQKSGVWFGVSLGLHAALLFSLAFAGVFAWDPPQAPVETVVELALGSLAGPGGSGGDGQLPGGGNGGAAVAAPPAPPAPQENRPADPPEAPHEASPQPQLVLTPQPVPEPTKPPETKPALKPTVAPKDEPAPPPRRKPRYRAPVREANAAVAPPPTAVAAAPGVQGTGVGSGAGVGALDGPGQGKGPGQGAGPGGFGELGPGGGGGGEYVGQFGRGDGPVFRHRALPQYPSEAKREDREGKVVLRLSIDAEGLLHDAEVVSHTGLEFAEEALRAIRKSSFLPAKRNGHPVPSKALLAVRFKLE